MSEALHFIPRDPRFVRERFDEIQMRGEPWITKNLIPRHGVGHLTGPSGSFKTFLALDWSFRITEGEPILNHRTSGCGVVYIAAEAPSGVRRRIAAWRKRHPDRSGLPFEMIGRAPDLRDTDQVDDLIAELRLARDEMDDSGVRLGLVVVDTLATAMAGADENSGPDMSAVLANLNRVGAEIGAFILLVSHTGKDATRGIRGWSGQHANADCVFFLEREEGSTTSIGRVGKLKDGEDGERFAFNLDKVSLGFDDDEDEITSCVVEYQDAPTLKARKLKPLNPGEVILLAAIEHVTDHGSTHPVPASAVGAQTWMKAVTREDIRTRAMATAFGDSTEKADTLRQRFFRSFQSLVSGGRINVEGESVWLIGRRKP